MPSGRVSRHVWKSAMKVCAEAGCPRIQSESRCPEHTRDRDRSRGTRQERGYDAAHDNLRARFERAMASGRVYTCWRCGRVVFPHAFDLGHCDDDRSVYHGPEHPACNRGARGRCPHESHSPARSKEGGEGPP